MTYKILSKKRPGVSLLISLGLITILLLASIGVTTTVISSIRQSANVTAATEAYYAAQSGLELGLLENINKGAGFTSTSTIKSYFEGEKPGIYNTYEIKGQVDSRKIDTFYIIPSLGTGTVGKNCDPLKISDKEVYFENGIYYASNTTTKSRISVSPIDHPCNWNKIRVGETVAIPLYVTQPDGTGLKVLNPADPGFNLKELKLKIRTPCKDGKEWCLSSERYDLDIFNGDKTLKCTLSPIKTHFCGDTIISWQIVGKNKKGDRTYTLSPDGSTGVFTGGTRRKKENSEIYESLINDANSSILPSGLNCLQYCVLYEERQGEELISRKFGSIKEFVRNEGTPTSFSRDGDDKINKPVLKISVVHSISDATKSSIPYLEYQINIITSSDTPPTDTVQTITAEGFSGSFKQVLQVKVPQEASLLEYVIQQ